MSKKASARAEESDSDSDVELDGLDMEGQEESVEDADDGASSSSGDCKTRVLASTVCEYIVIKFRETIQSPAFVST